jgi:thiamine-monophosphate kinase
MPGEFDFLEWIRSQQTPSPLISVGVGDDLAVLSWPKDDLLIVGVDQVLDGVHFDSKVHPPRAIGRKVMNRNLSDCAAMACLPAAAVATVALPRGVGEDYAKQLFLGMKEAGAVFDCAIVGGDTGSWDGKLAMTVTILGRSAGIQPVLRSGAKAGDGIYVSGPLGGSILGRHMTFSPRVDLGRELAKRGDAAAMIDLSDGLSRDLRHICRLSGNLGAVIYAGRVPIHDDAQAAFRTDRVPPLDHALNDGEDYELLFTCRNVATMGIYIGDISSAPGIWLEHADDTRESLEPKAWEHSL